jgi:hypothetical protein
VFTATDYYIYVDIIYKELFAISYTRYLRYTFKDLLGKLFRTVVNSNLLSEV